MSDLCVYQISLRGPIDTTDLEDFCPPECRIKTSENGSALLTVVCDQSGMIGLIRRLHAVGLVLLSIYCYPVDESNHEKISLIRNIGKTS